MEISIPDSLTGFIAGRVRSGGYKTADAFVADLVRSEADVMDGAQRGEPIAVNGRFDRRLVALLDEATDSGDFQEATSRDFDELEREAPGLVGQHRIEKTP